MHSRIKNNNIIPKQYLKDLIEAKKKYLLYSCWGKYR